MFKRQVFFAAILLIPIVTLLAAQPESTPPQPVGPDPNQPAAGNILETIPADSLGFMVIPNLKDGIAALENMSKLTGMSETTPIKPGALLPMLAGQLGLGKGFNPNGGVAVVVTDFAKSGLSVKDLVDNPKAMDNSQPFALVLAAKDAKSAFPIPDMVKTVDGKTVVMMAGIGLAQTRKVGDYLVLSSNPKVLQQFGTGDNVLKTMPEAQKGTIKSTDASMYMNIDAIVPIIEEMLKLQKEKMEAAMAAETGAATEQNTQPPVANTPLLGMFDMAASQLEMAKQLDALAMGVQMKDAGMSIVYTFDCVEGSKLAEQMTAIKPAKSSLLGRLPSDLWVMAGGAAASGPYPEETANAFDMIFKQMAMVGFKIPEKIQKKTTDLMKALNKEIGEVRFVGGSPEGAGLFNFTMLMSCEDTKKMKTRLAESADLINEIVQTTMVPREPDLESFKLEYVAGCATAGEFSVDAIEIKHDDLNEMDAEEKADMTKVLGDGKLRILVASPDTKTVAVTFGGGVESMKAAIATAGQEGEIQKQPGVAAAMKHLPEKRYFTVVFSLKNMVEAVKKAAIKMGEDPEEVPVKAESDIPIAMGASASGKSARMVIFVPTATIKDFVNIGQAFFQPPPPPGAQPKGPADF